MTKIGKGMNCEIEVDQVNGRPAYAVIKQGEIEITIHYWQYDDLINKLKELQNE